MWMDLRLYRSSSRNSSFINLGWNILRPKYLTIGSPWDGEDDPQHHCSTVSFPNRTCFVAWILLALLLGIDWKEKIFSQRFSVFVLVEVVGAYYTYCTVVYFTAHRYARAPAWVSTESTVRTFATGLQRSTARRAHFPRGRMPIVYQVSSLLCASSQVRSHTFY